jgi:hypothetical protein
MATPDLRGLLLVALVSAWLAGILLDQVLLVPSLALLAGAGMSLVLVVIFWHHAQGRLIMLALLCLLLGAWRYASVPRRWESSCKLPSGGCVFYNTCETWNRTGAVAVVFGAMAPTYLCPG